MLKKREGIFYINMYFFFISRDLFRLEKQLITENTLTFIIQQTFKHFIYVL